MSVVAGEGSLVSGGDVGEVLGVCVPEAGLLASLSPAMLLLRDFAPIRLFFSLNFSSHEVEFASLRCWS